MDETDSSRSSVYKSNYDNILNFQAIRNTVPVPRHWCFKRKYLAGKRGFEKPPFQLPEFIRRTGIMEMRQALQEKVIFRL